MEKGRLVKGGELGATVVIPKKYGCELDIQRENIEDNIKYNQYKNSYKILKHLKGTNMQHSGHTGQFFSN